MNKIIFLDFDGVLNTEEYQRELQEADKPREDRYGRLFSPAAMDNLYRIVCATGAKIVVISSWKGIYGLDGLRQMWRERKYIGDIHDTTRNGVSDQWLLNVDLSELSDYTFPHPKGLEIADYLKTHNISNYAILDDESIAWEEQKKHLFQTDAHVGLTKEIAEKVIYSIIGK